MHITSNYVIYSKNRVLRMWVVSLNQAMFVSILFPWMHTNGVLQRVELYIFIFEPFFPFVISLGTYHRLNIRTCQVLNRKNCKETWHRHKEMTHAKEKYTYMPAGIRTRTIVSILMTFPSFFLSLFSYVLILEEGVWVPILILHGF